MQTYLWQAIFDMLYVQFYMQRDVIHLWYIHIVMSSMSESIYVVSKNPFACFKPLITRAKIAHSVNFCCIQFAMLHCHKHAFMLKIICCMSRLTFWPLVEIIIELFLDMTLACDRTLIKYPTWIKLFMELNCTNHFSTYTEWAHNINEIKHMTNKIAHVGDGFRHGANFFGCNMNEYRHMT